MIIIFILWFVAIGAAIGSFLNVVIWRLPRGESLIHPPSHCPKCGKKIRFYDNLPILGWGFLRGKCRDCGLPINFRYPLIETLVALFAGVILTALLPPEMGFVRPVNTEAILLTSQEVNQYGDLLKNTGGKTTITLIATPFSELIVRVLWLFWLHSFLLTVGVIEWDRQKIPKIAVFLTLIIGVMTGIICPWLYPIPWNTFWPWEKVLDVYLLGRNLPTYSAFDILFGMLCGGILGYLTSKLLPKAQQGGWFWAFLVVGLFLGWQITWIVLLTSLLLHLTVHFVGRKPIPLLCLTFCSFLINIILILQAPPLD